MTRQDSLLGFRIGAATVAALIGLVALWVMAGELMSPRVAYFPTNPGEAQTVNASQDLAATAAQVGMIRGDLWTTAAVTRAAPLLFAAAGNSPGQGVETARAIAERAARLSPYDSRNWLMLAGLNLRSGQANAKTAEILKLSYYTGPEEISLIPLRVLLAVQSDAIADDELQSLVQLDIQHLVTQRPDLKPAIALAYKNALPKGRDVIQSTLAKIDPKFLATIVPPAPPPPQPRAQ